MFNNCKDLVKDYKHIIVNNNEHIVIDKDEEQLVICLDLSKVDEYVLEVLDNVKAKVVEIVSLDNSCNVNKKVICKENASLELVSVELSNGNKNVINVKTFLEKGSYINNKKISLYDGTYDCSSETNLNGEFSSCESTNVLINSCGQIVNTSEVVNHNASDTTSVLFNYGICKNVSILNINTNGYVIKDAKRSNLRQKSKGILLDEASSISANPWLQIDEFDCLASHGAGIGAIDEEDLYYLMSRGLTKTESEKLIIGGFVDPVYASLPEGKIKEYVSGLVKKYL